jgi:hypothetical protein
MAKVMYTLALPAGPHSADEVRSRLGLADDELDDSFGVIEVDPDEHLFTILVEETAAARLTGRDDWKLQGPYSNPRIAPFGPPSESGSGDEAGSGPAREA